MFRTPHNYNQRTNQNRQLNPINLRDPNLRHKSNNLPFITRALVISPEQRNTPTDELLRAQKDLFELDKISPDTPQYNYNQVYVQTLGKDPNEAMIRAANQEVTPRLRAMSGLIAARLTKGQTSPEGPNTLIQDYTYSRLQSPLLKQISASFSANTHPNQICPEELPSLIQDLMM